MACRVESVRALPPATTPASLPYRPSSAVTWAANSSAMTTSTSSTDGAWSKAATQCSSSVRPASRRSCLGMLPPNRRPLPPARTTATVCMTGPYRAARAPAARAIDLGTRSRQQALTRPGPQPGLT